MPLVDLSEKELLEYRGRNEKPDDFDAFWDKGIREMEALGTEAEFRRMPNAFICTFMGWEAPSFTAFTSGRRM